MRLTAMLVALCFMLPAGLAEAQTRAMQLTPEQQRMLDRLPPAQRAEVTRQIRQFQTQERRRADGDQLPLPVEEPAFVEPVVEREDDPEVIKPDDTLIVEILFPPPPEGDVSALIPRRHLLRGRHTVKLDSLGRLTLPGLPDIPLAGLKAEQAELRLMAEPMLTDMVVFVTRLTLRPVGRDALEPFGYTIFKRPVDRLTPLRAPSLMPVAADYIVGPGDIVQLYLFGKQAGLHEISITRDGILHVPELGPVSVAGMRFSAMKALVERRVREETIGMQASVSMGELRSIDVLVVGEVTRPGMHSIGGTSTVIDALYAAEGITLIGSLRNILVFRGGEVQGTLDLYELLVDGNPLGDIRLQAGDVIFIPPPGPRAGVMGETLRPAWYELRGDTTVGRLLDIAGGGGLLADLRRVQIERQGSDGQIQFIDVDVTTDRGRAVAVRAGDLLNIPRASTTPATALAVRGHFERPGIREWRDGLRVADLLNGGRALKPDPDLDYALVVRRLDDGRGVRIDMFSPREALADPGSRHNLALDPRDEVLTFGFDDAVGRRALVEPLIERLRRQAMQDAGARIVRVTGAVRVPGLYPLADGMRLSDLAFAGGGLAESAYHRSAEVTRFETSNGARRQIEHIEIDLARVMARDPGADLRVQPHDVLNIKEMPQWTERGTVELRGEVRFPGVYPIRPGEMLSQVIERAGGLTEHAFPRAAVFTRESLREREQRQIDAMVRRLEADIAAAAAQGGPAGAQAAALGTSMMEQLRETEAAGRLVINLSRIISSPGDPDHDVLVHDGDLLAIPPRPQEITVLGEVNFPTSHIYDPELARNQYLDRSGGTTQRADTRRIYVVRADGAVESAGGRRGRVNIEPGDTIVVPLDAERLPAMVRIMNISQVVYQLAIAAAAWNALGVF